MIRRERTGVLPAARRHEAATVVVVAALGLVSGGCDWIGGGRTQAWRADAAALNQPATEVRLRSRKSASPVLAAPAFLAGLPVVAKVDSGVEARAAAAPDRTETLLITYRDPFIAHRDSVFAYTGSPFAADTGKFAGTNVAQLLLVRRAPELNRLRDSLVQQHGAIVLPQRFAFTHSLLVSVRLREVAAIAQDPRVVRIDPLWGEGPPQGPGCGGAEDNLETIREHVLDCERFFDAGFGSGTIDLLDTGVHSAHALLGPERIAFQLDCATAPWTCTDADPAGDVWSTGHGTATSAILAGTEAQGESHRGLTEASIESYRVYGYPLENEEAKVSYPGAVSAFDAILTGNPDIIVAEIATGYGGYGSLTQEASWAFDRGAVVIAPSGNLNWRKLAQPANAPRALGVGMYCMQALDAFRMDTAWGQTPDNRSKPDLGAPTGAYTATKRDADPAKLDNFNGTSGAAPMVAGAALLLRNWMRQGGAIVSPGHVYAMLLMCGQRSSPHAPEGAGKIRLPRGGLVWWGIVAVEHGKQVTLDLDTGSLQASGLEAAIWWPEYGIGGGAIPSLAERAAISLQAFDPKGNPSESSAGSGTVYQKSSMSRGLDVDGNVWKLAIKGSHVPGSPRQAYFAVWARP